MDVDVYVFHCMHVYSCFLQNTICLYENVPLVKMALKGCFKCNHNLWNDRRGLVNSGCEDEGKFRLESYDKETSLFWCLHTF